MAFDRRSLGRKLHLSSISLAATVNVMPRYDLIVWKDEGVWTAHSPSISGVYGVGTTAREAKADFAAAATEMLDYLDEIGEPPPRRTEVRLYDVDL